MGEPTAEPPAKKRRPGTGGKYTVCEEAAPGARWTRFPIRVRAHRNPLSDNDDVHPRSPADVLWDGMYPQRGEKRVEYADVGCAYGGLLCKLAPQFPETLMMGLEIRDKVAAFSQSRIERLRKGEGIEGEQSVAEHHYNNIWVMQANAMKYLPNLFEKGQLKRLSFCYPDPHYKKKNFRRRIIQEVLTHEYAYVLADGGLLYTVTDVEELAQWMQSILDASPLFERLTDAEVEADPFIQYVAHSSEDAIRTEKRNLGKHYAIHRKRVMPPL